MSTAVGAPPATEAVDARTHALRHVFPCSPWLSAAILATQGLLRYYRLQETSGTSATDSASGSTGTYTNSPTLGAAGLWTPDDATVYSATFASGSSQYVSVPTVNFSGPAKSFTIEAVISTASLATRRWFGVSGGSAAAGNHIVLWSDVNGQLYLDFYSAACGSGNGAITAGAAAHVVGTYDGATDTAAIYVNGVLKGTNNVGPYTGSTTPTVWLGGWYANGAPEYVTGSMSDVAIYSRALTAAEVLAHAEASGLASTSSSNGVALTRSSTLVLGKPYRAKALPIAYAPGSADLAAGSYTHRLNDSGEFSLTFPNREASDGLPWRERFDTAGHLEFVEVWRDDVLEFVGSVQRIAVDRGQVTVSGPDAFGLLRKAYESDRSWTAGPADVVDTYTGVWRDLVAEEFTSDPGTKFRRATSGFSSDASSTTLSVANGIATFANAAGTGLYVSVPVNAHDAPGDWQLDIVFAAGSTATGGTFDPFLGVLDKDGATQFWVSVTASTATTGSAAVTFRVSGSTNIVGPTYPVPISGMLPMTMTLRRAGRWLFAYVNGKAVGVGPAPTYAPGRLVFGSFTGSSITLKVESLRYRVRSPFLRRSTTTHDRYLPGDYPTGGLRGRYWSDTDLQGLSASDRAAQILAPQRQPRDERLDATVNTGSITVPVSGATDYFSVRWFGAVYLRGDLGDYQVRLSGMVGGGRVWVGKTGWGDQVIDDWTVAGSRTTSATVDSTAWGDRAGWVPIVVEFHDDANTQAVALDFYSPSAYTDPGGTAIAATTWTTIPSTSLSPLGCFDNRTQGASHFDLVQQAASTFGLSLWCEPQQLESGEFPGRLLAKARYGRDTDVILQGEDVDPAEPLIGPSSEVDATDIATTVRGGGAGASSGSAVVGETFDPSSALAALFDLQAYTDAADITIRDLLGARLEAELALRLVPWQNITGTPRAQERLADTFPLAGSYSAMRWRPGDAVRLWLPEVGVADYVPRQIIQVTRDFQPDGRTATSVGFRQRPKAVGSTLRRLTRAALAPQRTYQRGLVTLSSTRVVDTVGAGSYTNVMYLNLSPADQVLRCMVSIVGNSAAQSLGLEINGNDRTSALGGGWTLVPLAVDATAYAAPNSSTDNRLYMRVKNNGGSSTIIEAQFFLDVLR